MLCREGIIQPGTVLVPSQGRPSVTLSTAVAACAEAIKVALPGYLALLCRMCVCAIVQMEKSKVWDIQKMRKGEWLVQVSQLKRELYDTIDLPIG